MSCRRAEPAEARRQAAWIAAIEPWRSLGYSAAALGRWLARSARDGRVLVATARGEVLGVLVVQPDVLLGSFISLVAVKPEAAGQGLGRALVDKAAAATFRKRRWLYTSSDAGNAPAGKFWRRMGFTRVGKLPDLVKAGHTEILWRRGRV